jgi:hypothetical protein
MAGPALAVDDNRISCSFSLFNGGLEISQRLDIYKLKTTAETRKLGGQLRASNSANWIHLQPESFRKISTNLAGDYGELLTIKHLSNSVSLSKMEWHPATLVDSNGEQVATRQGRCYVQ